MVEKFDKKDTAIRNTKIKDPSCCEWLLKCCCCLSSDNMAVEEIRYAPADNYLPVSSKQLPQKTGSTMPTVDKDKSCKNDDEKIVEPAKSSNGSTPGPQSHQEQTPAPAIQAQLKQEKEGERLTSRASVKAEGELKPSDTGATRAQIIAERVENYPSSHGSVRHKDELQPADTGKVHDKEYGYDNSSLVSPHEATKANQISWDKPKGELKPVDKRKIPNRGYDYDDTLVSLQAKQGSQESKAASKERVIKYISWVSKQQYSSSRGFKTRKREA